MTTPHQLATTARSRALTFTLPRSSLPHPAQYAFGCLLYELAHIGTGVGIRPGRAVPSSGTTEESSESSGTPKQGSLFPHVLAQAGLSSATLFSPSRAGRTAGGGTAAFGWEAVATAWTFAHEESAWWGDSVLLRLPAITGAMQRTDSGFRLQVLPHVPAVFSALITACTAFQPAQRPSFAQLRERLKEALQAEAAGRGSSSTSSSEPAVRADAAHSAEAPAMPLAGGGGGEQEVSALFVTVRSASSITGKL